MVTSRQGFDSETDLLAIIEDCLNNYASNVHLFQSPLATWEVVQCRLPVGTMPTPEQLSLTVRAVLDDLIEALRSSDSCDLNSPSVRRYIIADQLYRRGLKQTEICPSRLPLSKSQFYRERTETLLALANYVQQWEQRTVEQRKLRAMQTLAAASSTGHLSLVGIDSLVVQLTDALTSHEGAKLILLSGLGGVGKTTAARSAVERVLQLDRFDALAWINCQADLFTSTQTQTRQVPALTMDAFFGQMLWQLRPNPVSDRCVFDQIAEQAGAEKITFDQLLGVLHQEHERHEPSHLPLTEKRALVADFLWAVPTLIVVDGLEGFSDPQGLIQELSHLASRTNLKVLITSRYRFSEHHGAKLLHRRGLAASETIQFLRAYALERGTEAVDKATPDDLQRLVDASSGNPLVIQWIVNQLAVLPVQQVLSGLSSGTEAEIFGFIYQNTWESLSGPAQQVIGAIVRSTMAENGWDALQRSTRLRPDVLNRSLQELVAQSLVDVSAGSAPSYEVVPMTRAFVQNASNVETDHPWTPQFVETYRLQTNSDLADRIARKNTCRRWVREYRK